MATISESDLKKKLQQKFSEFICDESSNKTIIDSINIGLVDRCRRKEVRIPAKGCLTDTPLKKIEEEIKQLEQELNSVNAKDIYIYEGYKYVEVRYSYYYGRIEFKTFHTDKGSVKIDVKITSEQIEAIKSLIFQNVLKTCEDQIKNFQDIFIKEVDQEKVESAVNKSFISKLSDKLQLKSFVKKFKEGDHVQTNYIYERDVLGSAKAGVVVNEFEDEQPFNKKKITLHLVEFKDYAGIKRTLNSVYLEKTN